MVLTDLIKTILKVKVSSIIEMLMLFTYGTILFVLFDCLFQQQVFFIINHLKCL